MLMLTWIQYGFPAMAKIAESLQKKTDVNTSEHSHGGNARLSKALFSRVSTAMLKRDIDIGILSVRSSVTLHHCIETA